VKQIRASLHTAPHCANQPAPFMHDAMMVSVHKYRWMDPLVSHLCSQINIWGPFGWNYKPVKKHCWLIFYKRKILFRLKKISRIRRIISQMNRVILYPLSPTSTAGTLIPAGPIPCMHLLSSVTLKQLAGPHSSVKLLKLF
jgi:hypothetical protein